MTTSRSLLHRAASVLTWCWTFGVAMSLTGSGLILTLLSVLNGRPEVVFAGVVLSILGLSMWDIYAHSRRLRRPLES